MRRRRFLHLAGVGGALVAVPSLAACGGDDDDGPASAVPTGTRTLPSADGRRGPGQGVLRTAERTLTTSLDPDTAQAGFTMMGYGMVETLMRLSPTFQPEPWIAREVSNVDPLTWRVALRDDVTFWDGSPVDAAAVKTSLERSVEMQPALTELLPAGTTFEVEGESLLIQTPRPVGALPSYLAAYNLTINRVTADGAILSTGPFRPSDFADGRSVTADAYAGYRGGPPGLEGLEIRSVVDVSARVLALQAGDVALAASLLPSHVQQLGNAGFEVLTAPTVRQNIIALNLREGPLNDVAVRRAFSLAIDREALVAGVLDGVGTPAHAIVPENSGIQGLQPVQRFDLAEANQVLDAAGWERGDGGVREKDGQRLQFRLASYASRAELKPLSIAIQDQVREAGFDLTLYEEADITTAITENNFDAAFYAYNTMTYGDLNRVFGAFFIPNEGTNHDRYRNDRVTEAAGEYAEAIEPARRIELLGSIQEEIAADVPIIHVVNPHDVIAFSKEVSGFVVHPLENYKYHADMTIEA